MTRPHTVTTFGDLIAISGPLPAQTLVPAGSEIAFTSRQMGVAVDGRFRSPG